MNISVNGIDFIKSEEGFIAVPRIDTDRLCWGYGHNQLPGEHIPQSISPIDAERLLHSDLLPHVAAVNQHAPWITIQNQFDALVSFAFNAGDRSLSQLLSHGRDSIPAQLPRWAHATIKGKTVTLPALVARRARELALYQMEEAA